SALQTLQKQKTGGEIAAGPNGLVAIGPLAICFTWLQADRPNHHGQTAFRTARPLRQRQSLLEAGGPFKLECKAMTTEPRPQPRRGVMEIDAYVPGKSHAPAGVAKVHKLSANENPLGPSPKAVEAARAVAEKLQLYPDGAATRLREAIAATHGLNVANIMAFNGSDEAIALLTRTYVGEGEEGLYTEHGFLAYPI